MTPWTTTSLRAWFGAATCWPASWPHCAWKTWWRRRPGRRGRTFEVGTPVACEIRDAGLPYGRTRPSASMSTGPLQARQA